MSNCSLRKYVALLLPWPTLKVWQCRKILDPKMSWKVSILFEHHGNLGPEFWETPISWHFRSMLSQFKSCSHRWSEVIVWLWQSQRLARPGCGQRWDSGDLGCQFLAASYSTYYSTCRRVVWILARRKSTMRSHGEGRVSDCWNPRKMDMRNEISCVTLVYI